MWPTFPANLFVAMDGCAFSDELAIERPAPCPPRPLTERAHPRILRTERKTVPKPLCQNPILEDR